ncbi:hypothetical protein [Candidatus Methylospira mobilis]|uniref:hypothetical protein n=1 Tax=Candidatus Methylospira mobilis TaxID=1808979 RepID=UPI00188598CD|nr:hypothetical protein [Candidatus Methylospira mobilis]
MAVLDTELSTYRHLLPTLLQDEGKFAVIHGEDFLGAYVSYEDALKVGYDKCGLTPFLVQQISSAEHIAYFTRDLGTSCPA